MSKDSYYFQHDSHARHDPKIIALINKYGLEGYGRFWVVIEMLRESSFYRLEDKEYMWYALAEQMHISEEETHKFIKDCIEKFELLQLNDGLIYSNALLLRMNKLDDIRAKRKRSAEIRWEITNA